MTTFADIKNSVTRLTDVKASVVAFIQATVQKLKDAGTEEERAAVIAELESDSNALAEAIVANTPAAAARR